MKINKLDAHDRLIQFRKQSDDIGECCQDLINQKPFGEYPFYIFAHARTEDDGVNKRVIWQPRLTKPTAQTNSMLFKAYPGSDKIKVIWMIPDRALWPQYTRGLMLENQTICESIDKFEHHRELLNSKEEDDLSDEIVDAIYRQLSAEAKRKKATLLPFEKI